MNAMQGSTFLARLQTEPDVKRAALDVQLAEGRLDTVQRRVEGDRRRGHPPNAGVSNAIHVYERDLQDKRATYQQTLDVATRRLWQQALNDPPASPTPAPAISVGDSAVSIGGLTVPRRA